MGLASRGNPKLSVDDILYAVERGVRFLNWPALAEGDEAPPDAMSRAISGLGPMRDEIVVCAQFGARTGTDARRELKALLSALKTDYVDVLTLYYVEEWGEWQALCARGGALPFLCEMKEEGVVRKIGVTTHQRSLAARMAESGEIDVLMIRYNAAHRGAEEDLFPLTTRLALPVICYTATRWGALLKPFRNEPEAKEYPPDVAPPALGAPLWYRFVLQEPAASVVLCAPATRAELDEDLTVLAATGPLGREEYEQLARHGERIRKMSGRFD